MEGQKPVLRKAGKSLKLVPAICPQCSAQLAVEPQMDELFCQHCGTKFLVDTAINKYNIQFTTINHTNNFQIGRKGTAEAFFEYSERMAERSAKNAGKELVQVLIALVGACAFLFILLSVFNRDHVAVNSSSDSLVGENYASVITALNDAGFTNIKTKVIDVAAGSNTEGGAVAKIAIDGQTAFSSDDSFKKDIEIIVTYYISPD